MTNTHLRLFASIGTVACAAFGSAFNWYVDQVNGSAANSGFSWAQAKNTVQAAVSAAAPGDTIHLRTGTYLVNGAYGPLVINKTLTLLGGYSYCGLRNARTSPSYLYNMGPSNAANPPILTKTGNGNLNVDGVRFWVGYSADGAGLDASGGTVTLVDCWFAIGTATGSGGCVRMQNGTLNVRRSRFSSGTASNGGGIHASNGTVSILSSYFDFNQASPFGGALFLSGTNGEVSNNTFFSSMAPSGPVMYHVSGSVVFKNNLINMPLATAYAAVYATTSNPGITLGNNHWHNWPGTYYSWTASGPGDAATNPLLASDNLHLLAGSPCVDSGDPGVTMSTNDYDGEVRVHNGTIDRGADELAPRNKLMFLSGCLKLVGTLGGATSGTLFITNDEGIGVGVDVNTGADGQFQYQVDALPYGLYTASMKGRNTLRQSVLIEVSADDPILSFALIPGDIDDDNAVTVFDYNLLSAAFDSAPGQINWNPNADLDGDGTVSVFDYNLLSENFDKVGD